MDAKKGQSFTKLARALAIAAKKGSDPSSNAVLRLAVEKARQASMPKENIERAIKRGSGEGEGGDELHELRYEGYAPEGVALMIDVVTDNKNRTISEIRQIFNRFGASLGEPGSASYVFGSDAKNPSYKVPVSDEGKKKRILQLIEELEQNDDIQEVYSNLEI